VPGKAKDKAKSERDLVSHIAGGLRDLATALALKLRTMDDALASFVKLHGDKLRAAEERLAKLEEALNAINQRLQELDALWRRVDALERCVDPAEALMYTDTLPKMVKAAIDQAELAKRALREHLLVEHSFTPQAASRRVGYT